MMIPTYMRVIAIDDVEDHLQKISWGLGKAGFCCLPFLFNDGRLDDPPEVPLQGVRIVFTDIHMVGGGANNEKVHAANIIRCLKKLISGGPYVLVFWSQFPEDGVNIARLIDEDGSSAGLTPPIAYRQIDKKLVFNVNAGAGLDEFNAEELRAKILECLEPQTTLALSLSWEDRVARAAASSTDTLFSLIKKTGDARLESWKGLLAFLAFEAVGRAQASADIVGALDSALLPVLEDELTSGPTTKFESMGGYAELRNAVSGEKRPKIPTEISTSRLNASYLIDESGDLSKASIWDRGMVTELGHGFINSGAFVRAFGYSDEELLKHEFLCSKQSEDVIRQLKLHIVSLDAECDHVQGKAKTRRYLLALSVPHQIIGACTHTSGNGSIKGYNNESVVDIGKISFKQTPDIVHHLLISCRCFMTMAAGVRVDGACRFRLRRGQLEEVMHRYTTHARRPGVMRFF